MTGEPHPPSHTPAAPDRPAADRPAVSASGRPLGPGDRRLIVVRHGITADNARGVWQGHLDTPLSEQGLAQARLVAPTLAGYRPHRIVSSDLARAARTADEVGRAAGCPVERDPRLREIHAGQWQGLSSAEVDARFPGAQAAVRAGEDVRRGQTGETLAEVAERVTAAATEVARTLQDGQVAILVTHGVAARALAAELSGLGQRAAWLGLAGLGNCCWGELREHDGHWRLFAWNLTAPTTQFEQGAEQSAY